jgi:acyl-CoA thioester hydrolase
VNNAGKTDSLKEKKMDNENLFITKVIVRFRDIDALGHVNNAVFFTYFEEGRKKFFQELFQISEPFGFGFILASISCDFLNSIKLSSQIMLQMWIKEIGKKSFHLGYKLVDWVDQSIIYATAQSVQVCFDKNMNKSVPVSEEFRKRVSKYHND